jgi:predicted RNA binding protein YcfA (HicA-like mRNA interferase family)
VADFGSDVRALLRENGCTFHRQGKGSHEIWYSPISDGYLAVPVKIRSRYTAKAILKQAGLPKAL